MLATQKGRSKPVLISLSRCEKDKVSPRRQFQFENHDFKFSASRCSATGLLTPAIRTTLFRLVSPLAMVTEEHGIANKSAKNSITAWLALPSTGGAVSASLRASPTMPLLWFLRARGWTLMAKVKPFADS